MPKILRESALIQPNFNFYVFRLYKKSNINWYSTGK